MSLQLERGVVGYWCPMLATTGLRLYDRAGRGNHGTLTNMDAASDWVTAKARNTNGRVLDFDGSNDRVLLSSKSSILNLRACSVVAWVNARTFGIDGRSVFSLPVADTADTAPFQALNLGFSATRYVNAGIGNGLTRSVFVSTDLQVSANSWNCIATVWDGANLTAGLNGLFSTGSTAAVYTGIGNSGTTGTARIGSYRDEATYSFDGRIAEVAIWNRALTRGEIRTLYRIGPGWFGRRDSRVFGYGEQLAASNRRRRILCGDYS